MHNVLTKQYPNLLLLSTFLFFWWCFSVPAHAESEFATKFVSHYELAENGPTHITHTITLTNQFSHLYLTEYTILLEPGITSLSATQDGSPLTPLLEAGKDSTTVTLKELIPVVGQHQSTTLTFSFFAPDQSERLPRTIAINIPRLAKANEASDYQRIVSVPSSFGIPTHQYPPASSVSSDTDGATIFTFKGYPNRSLSLLFGVSQPYLLELSYFLTNPSLSVSDTELALPPDTPYQRVYLDNLDPSPREIRLDSDGNWLAIYSLKPKESLSVQAKLYLDISPLPNNVVIPPPADLSSLLSSQPYWETNHSLVKELAQQLRTPENIYQYLTENLVYDYSRLTPSPRLGAAHSLSSPHSALCTEFADAFVALARAGGIPAREIQGYAYSRDSSRPIPATADVLHSWAEYYLDKEGFRQIDPTWGQTAGGTDYFHKLDYSHLAFVIHGSESDYPLPPGAYKTDPSVKTVNVTPVAEFPESSPTWEEIETEQGKEVVNRGHSAVLHPQLGYLPPMGHVAAASFILPSSFTLPRLYPYFLLGIILFIVFFLLRRRRRG